MAQHGAEVRWRRRGDEPFTDNRFSRAHDWSFDGGLTVPASSSPLVLPRQSDPAGIDPEEALIAALSSCHMMAFLYLAAKAGLVVEAYEDKAVGTLSKTDGRVWLSQVTLRPHVTWGGPAPEDLLALHHAAHAECYIASSVKTEVRCEPA